MTTPPYLRRIILARVAGLIPLKAPVQIVITHETGCPGTKVPFACRCSPVIEVEVPGELLVIGEAGELIDRRDR